MSVLNVIAIGIIGIVSYIVMAEALKDFSTFNSPRTIAALVSVIGCIGLQQTGGPLVSALLIPFAALLLAVAAVWAASLFTGKSIWPKRIPRRDADNAEEDGDKGFSWKKDHSRPL